MRRRTTPYVHSLLITRCQDNELLTYVKPRLFVTLKILRVFNPSIKGLYFQLNNLERSGPQMFPTANVSVDKFGKQFVVKLIEITN